MFTIQNRMNNRSNICYSSGSFTNLLNIDIVGDIRDFIVGIGKK